VFEQVPGEEEDGCHNPYGDGNAREVAVATGKLVSGEGKAAVGSVRVDDFTPMIEFLASHKILGDKKTPKAADICVPLTSN